MSDHVKPAISVTGFWMRNRTDGCVEVLVQHEGKWITVFGTDGPGPVACDKDQLIDHVIHGGGIQNLLDHGTIHSLPRRCASCGHLATPHRYRHPFVLWKPGMPMPKKG